ncbi:DUF885 domain-containing protein [Streptosporangium sp. NPDC051022]|uniref:DUF885 domain-containing protein n=1 Tax=Streptosporangium sp. NPDC051022 TaxID=3155752 RepID=UPI003420CEE9
MPETGTAPRGEAAGRLDALADRMLAVTAEADPFFGTLIGLPAAAAHVPDPTDTSRERHSAAYRDLAARAAAIDPAELDSEDRITRGMLVDQSTDCANLLDVRREEFTVSPFNQASVPTAATVLVPKAQVGDAAEAEAYLSRIRGLTGMLDAGRELLGRGAASGRLPVARLVADAVTQLDGHLGTALADDPLLRPGTGRDWRGADAWRERVRAEVADRVRPALGRYRDDLAGRALPTGRPDTRPGVCWIPGGEEAYAALARFHTTVTLDAAAVHAQGLELVDRLAEEARGYAARAFGTSDLSEARDRLRADPGLGYPDEAAVLAAARAALDRAWRVLPDWLDTVPGAEITVRVVPPAEAADSMIGYYRPGPPGGRWPGTFWVHPGVRSYELAALAAHESVPGHHVQWSLAREAGLRSAYRRITVVTSFLEGWALYTERLADEMGLYAGDLDRLGMWSMHSLRAARLVVDTGLHAFGWTRERAVTYLMENTATSARNCAAEVDRYIGNPGQALAYMTGRLVVTDLREAAERRLGPRFRAGAFHARLLGNGALPLGTLREVITDWLDEQEAA